ncbi:MAG: carbohydrate kinase family protein [Planctomycetaceae bacterium]|nr:carbohydrate kinase family protein [Planctomycetaceae bacterium]
MAKDLDCVLCGSCVVDILVRPVPLEHPIGGGRLLHAEPINVTTGGLVSNAGVTMARLGMRPAAFSYVGNDDWAPVIRRRYESEGVDCCGLLTHPTGATSTTAVLIDPSGERSFAHCVGAPKLMDKSLLLGHLDLFARSRMMLIGYYSLMPNLENDLPEVLAAIRKTGCQTAIDAAGDGGGMTPLDRILPHVDVYVPSYREGVHQTGFDDPRKMIDAYRACGAPGVLGVKLGSKGAMLSPAAGQYIEIDCVRAPGPVVDTTGAGDCFFAGLLTGLLRGLDVAAAGRLAAATGACCVTGYGATAGIRSYEETAKLANV